MKLAARVSRGRARVAPVFCCRHVRRRARHHDDVWGDGRPRRIPP
jgi:hypothetical protein